MFIVNNIFAISVFCLSCLYLVTGTVGDTNSYPGSPNTAYTSQSDVRESRDLSNGNVVSNNSNLTTYDRSANSTTFDARQHPNYHLLPGISECGISAAPKSKNTRSKRTTNGKPAGFGKYLMVAQIIQQNVSTDSEYIRCTGALISSRYVLTSAQCSSRLTTGLIISRVKLGRYDMTTSYECTPYNFENRSCNLEINRGVEEIIVHDDFNWRSSENDISLIRLNEGINLTDFVKPACLPYTQEMVDNLEGQTVSVAGWGDLSSYDDLTVRVDADKLSEINMTLVSNEYCEIFSTSYFGNLGPGRICGLGKNGMDLCYGDLGGPMIKAISVGNEIRQFQIGVFSRPPTLFGANCGRQGVPEIFTNVIKYMPWILDNLKP